MSGAVLAQLMAQGAGEGADLTTLRAIAEEAGELAASRAMARLGLDDAAAAKDMAELRELLGAWRDAKRSVWKAALAWVVRIAGALLLTGLAAKFGFWDWVK
ncbi:DUF6127 family protein [Sphingomonas echinoides]|jgi:hypothetical protein|uniref:DUF6127 family protein n=1 Tax=Sphingomonas echinoides TaxID=59803 RepID=A0ABU4PHV3_9SPHN|nr:DUF6127 family protein [Sphingomonas echinoides]MDX5982662.1 DUF6127 family protein [Sphingomonas echinoides]